MSERVKVQQSLQRLSPAQVMHVLPIAYKLRRNVLLLGGSGIGKTDVVADTFAGDEFDFYVAHPVVHRPEVVSGLPLVSEREGVVKWIPFDLLANVIVGRVKKPTVVLLDDFAQARAETQAAYMQVLWAREINGHKIDEKVQFVLATNRPNDQGAINPLLGPLKRRVTMINMITSNADWIAWAQKKGIHPLLVAFHHKVATWMEPLDDQGNPKNILAPSFEENSFSPRGVEICDGWLKELEHDDQVLLRAALEGTNGVAWTTQFMQFMRLRDKIPSVDEILNDPKGTRVPKEPDLLAILVATLGHVTTKDTLDSAWVYMKRMGEDNRNACMAYAIRCHPEIRNTTVYIEEFARDISGMRKRAAEFVPKQRDKND